MKLREPKLNGYPSALIEDCKKYLGLAPYNTFTNTNVGSVPEINVNVDGIDVNPKIENIDDSTYNFTVVLDNLEFISDKKK